MKVGKRKKSAHSRSRGLILKIRRKTRNKSIYSSPIAEEAPSNFPHLILIKAHNPRDRSLIPKPQQRQHGKGRRLARGYTGSQGWTWTQAQQTASLLQVRRVAQTPASLWDLGHHAPSTPSSRSLGGRTVGLDRAALLRLPLPHPTAPRCP